MFEFIICIKTREENKQTKRRRINEVCSRSSTNEFNLMENANTFHSHSLDDDNNEDADIFRNSIRPDTSSTHTRCHASKKEIVVKELCTRKLMSSVSVECSYRRILLSVCKQRARMYFDCH